MNINNMVFNMICSLIVKLNCICIYSKFSIYTYIFVFTVHIQVFLCLQI